MSGKQTTKKAGSVLGKRPSLSSRASSATSSKQPSHAAKRNSQFNPPTEREHRDNREAKEEKEDSQDNSRHADVDDNDDDAGGKDDDSSSSDSDNADIAIDINTTQQLNTKTNKKHQPNASRSSTTATTTTTTTTAAAADSDIINVDFGLFDPLPDDDFTFRMLLKDYVPDHLTLPVRPSTASSSSGGSGGGSGVFALHEFCALISNQVEVGTTIKADGTDEPLGVITALPLPPLSTAPLPLYQLHSYLSSHVPAADKARLNALFSSSSHNVLIVQSRLLNTPTALIGPLHAALIEDIQWAAKQPTTSPTHPWQHIDRALILGRCVKGSSGVSSSGGGGGRRGGVDVWMRFEEEWYESESEWSCRWNVPYRRSEADGEGGVSEAHERREGHTAVLMCVRWDKVKQVVEHIQTMTKDA